MWTFEYSSYLLRSVFATASFSTSSRVQNMQLHSLKNLRKQITLTHKFLPCERKKKKCLPVNYMMHSIPSSQQIV